MVASIVTRLAIAVAVVTVARHDTPLVDSLRYPSGGVVGVLDVVAVRIGNLGGSSEVIVGVLGGLGGRALRMSQQSGYV